MSVEKLRKAKDLKIHIAANEKIQKILNRLGDSNNDFRHSQVFYPVFEIFVIRKNCYLNF